MPSGVAQEMQANKKLIMKLWAAFRTHSTLFKFYFLKIRNESEIQFAE